MGDGSAVRDLDARAASSPWRRSGFRWFFAGQLVSLFGTSMVSVALAFAVLDASGRGRDLGLVLAANSLPMLGFLLVGGAVADRFSRSVVLVVSHLGAAVTQGGVALLLLTGNYRLWAVMALGALNGTFAAFTSPALRGIIPQLVDRSAFQRANSARATSRHVTKIVGPTAAGLLVVTVGGGWAIAVDAASFLVAAVCMARLKLPAAMPAGGRGSAAPKAGRGSVITDIRAGWHEFRTLPWVVAIVGVFAVSNVIWVGIWFVLGPVLARQTVGEAAWGVVVSVRAVGLLIMGVVMYRLVIRHPLRVGQLCAALTAIPLIMLGLDVAAGWLVAAALLAGMGAAVVGIAWETALQEHVRPESLSRVASYDELGSFIGVPLGQLAAVPVAAAFGAPQVAVVGGVLYAVIVLAALASPAVRNLRHAT